MTSTTFSNVKLAHIVTSRTNPRKHFDAHKLSELATSIRATGVHTPVLLRPLPGARVANTAGMVPRPEFELVTGERRFRASGMISLVQRKLNIGYNRAARLLEALEQQGVVGPLTSAGLRDVKVVSEKAWPFPPLERAGA